MSKQVQGSQVATTDGREEETMPTSNDQMFYDAGDKVILSQLTQDA